MKYFLIIALNLLFLNSVKAQPDIYPDTFPAVRGYRSVVVKTDYFCSNPATKNKTTAKYLFDNAGNTTAFLSICDNKVCGRITYAYSGNQLVSRKNFSTWTGFADNMSKSRWDSTILSDEMLIQYSGTKISSYKYFQTDGTCSFEKSFTYGSAGKLISENMKTYYDSISQQLKTIHYAIADRKEYLYNDSVTTITYYRNNTLQAAEEIVSLKTGKVSRQVLRSVAGKILEKHSYKYNDKMQLIEINATITGYDGFGNTYDGMPYEKTVLIYDAAGKLAGKDQYYKGKLCNRDRYEYVK